MFGWLPLFSRLRARLAVIVAAALAPAGVLAVTQALSALEIAETRHLAQFESAALASIDEDRAAIAAIKQSIRQAASSLGFALAAGESCDVSLAALKDTGYWAIEPSVHDASGALVCGEDRRPPAEDSEGWKRFQETGDYTLFATLDETADGAPTLKAIHAVPRNDGLALSVGLDTGRLQHLLERRDPLERSAGRATAALIDARGKEILRVGSDDSSWLPEDRSIIMRNVDQRIETPDADGDERIYFVSVLEAGQLWAVTGTVPRDITGSLVSESVAAAAAPLILWLIAVAVVYFAIDALVTRHVANLRRTAVRIGSGDLNAPVADFDDAPQEIRSLASSVSVMRDNISKRDASLRETLDVQRRLIQEVHHRVKNNLQIISSLVNMESRRSMSPQSLATLRTIQNRIHSLAMVHQNLYSAERLEEVALDQLARDIASNLESSLGPKNGRSDIDFELEPLTASTTNATPIALFLSEAIGNAYKHGAPPYDLAVSLRRDGDEVRLSVSNKQFDQSSGDAADQEAPSGMGLALMEGFAKQIGARYSCKQEDGRFTVSLIGPIAEPAPLFSVRSRQKA